MTSSSLSGCSRLAWPCVPNKNSPTQKENNRPHLTLVCLLSKSWTVTTHTQRNGVRWPQFLLFLLELFLFDLEMITEMRATFGWFSDTKAFQSLILQFSLASASPSFDLFKKKKPSTYENHFSMSKYEERSHCADIVNTGHKEYYLLRSRNAE